MTAPPYSMVGRPDITAGLYQTSGAVGALAGGPRPMAVGPGPVTGIRPMGSAVGPLAGGPRRMAVGPDPVAGIRPLGNAVEPLAGGPRPMDPGGGNSSFMDLHPGSQLSPGDNLFSLKGAFVLTLQAQDGNLVLYAFNDWDSRWDVPLWSLVNEGVILPLQHPVAKMQTDGNFVVYAEYPTYPGNFYAAWNTGTFRHDGQGAFLRCQDDGNLVVYLPDGQALWWSNTYAGLR